VGSLFEVINGDSVTLFKYIFSFYVLIILVILVRAHGILTWTVENSWVVLPRHIKQNHPKVRLPSKLRTGSLALTYLGPTVLRLGQFGAAQGHLHLPLPFSA
jgi:hypothetical protein